MFLRSFSITISFILFHFGICAFATPGQSAEFPNKPAILITAFEPFGGAVVNQSMLVVEALGDRLKNIYDVKICILPTVYDESAAHAKKCFDEMQQRPKYVVGLGEGSCKVRVETAAQNFDATEIHDNGGSLRTGSPIIEGAPYWKTFSISPSELLQGINEEDVQKIRVSTDMGNFVCNNTAYHLATEWNKESDPKYAFIHVPNSRCQANEKDPEEISRLIFEMVSHLPIH